MKKRQGDHREQKKPLDHPLEGLETLDWLDEELRQDEAFAARVRDGLRELELRQQMVKARESAGLSQRDLAKRLGVSQPAVQQMETGKNLRVLSLIRYAVATNTQVRLSLKATRKSLKGRLEETTKRVKPVKRAAKKMTA